jgi:L-lactate dehydrogenase (cytochrome)
MYSVAALGNTGGHHAMGLLKAQLKQVLEQVGCLRPNELGKYLAK